MVSDHRLNHEGDIGADHHHLAMRHVDDAHHAEGDGKPGRGQQQHRPQAEAVIHALQQTPELQGEIDRLHRRGRRVNHGRRLVGEGGQQGARIDIAAVAQGGNGRQAVGFRGVAGGEQSGGARLLHGPFHAAVLLRGDRARQRRKAGRIARLEDRLRRGGTGGRIGVEQAQCAQRRVDRAADRIVDADRAHGAGIGGGLAGQRGDIAAFRQFDEQLLVGIQHQAAILQGTEDGVGARAAGNAKGFDPPADIVEILSCQGHDGLIGGIVGTGADWREQQETEQQETQHNAYLPRLGCRTRRMVSPDPAPRIQLLISRNRRTYRS